MSHNKQTKSSSARALSTTLSALLLFCALNAWLTLAPPRFCDPAEFPYHGWSYWSLKAMQQADPSSVNVVVLGSSLIAAAFPECDATFVQKQPLDLCFYRGAAYLDQQMRYRFERNYQTLNLAGPGQIPSDAYLTMKAALANGITPGVVIYCLAPRDFIDNTLKDTCDTEAFHYLSHIVDVRDCAQDLFRNPVTRLDWDLQRSFQLYGAAVHYSLAMDAAGSGALRCLLATIEGRQHGDIMRRRINGINGILPQYQPFNLNPGRAMAAVLKDPGPFLNNVQDYKDRYKQPNIAAYRTQIGFLERLITLCQSKHIGIILVNMPITKQNIELLDSTWRRQYFGDLARISTAHGVEFLDQCEFERYSRQDFRDSVHLNGFGGKKFIDRLVEKMAVRSGAAKAVLAAGNDEKRSMAASRATNFRAGIQ